MPPQSLDAAVASLLHRGPDDAGRFIDRQVALGFRRLAILDLSEAGHQPMRSEDGRHTLVFNGEIYNYLELRAELAALGHRFRSGGDTEVLLAAYRQWGGECVTRLNGMWSFVIHDGRTGGLFGARDRFGVKPLYIAQNDDWLLLASEPQAVGATGLFPLRPDMDRLSTAIRWERMDHDDGSCLQGIRQLPPAHRFMVDPVGRLEAQPYWQPPDEQAARDEPADRWVAELSALLTDSVRLRLRSDVPVGFTLSGGIDSSLLICEAARLGAPAGGLLAFSYQDPQFDEHEPIRDTVAQSGARLVSLPGTALDVAALLPQVLRANGEPVHSLSAVANYALFGLARAHGVKVLLGGQGADEVFAGYNTFQQARWHSLFEDRRWAALHADVRSFATLHGRGATRLLLDTLARSLRVAWSGNPVYRRLRDWRTVPARGLAWHDCFAVPFLRRSDDEARSGAAGRLGMVQRRSLRWWPLPMYLRIEDRVSMAHGVEARLPFMDYRLVEHALRMPDELKFSGGVNKVGLRRVATGRVPPSVTARMYKFGFPVGDSSAIATGLQALLRPLAHTAAFRRRDIYEHAAVDRLLAAAPDAADVDALLHVTQTELWLAGLEAGGAAS